LLSRKKPDCVTHVPGMNCHPSLRKGRLSSPETWVTDRTSDMGDNPPAELVAA
jgi:hypothetical protein